MTFLLVLAHCSLAAQPLLYESEPNDTPAEGNRVSGAAVIAGTMTGADQDGYIWTISDIDAQKRWTLELMGIPGVLTVVDVFRLEYAENGVDIADETRLFTIGSRDGATPAVAENVIFEPGEYLLGIANSGSASLGYRPPAGSISFDETGTRDETTEPKPPGGYRLVLREGDRLYLHHESPDNVDLESAHHLRLNREFSSFMTSPDTWFRIEIDEDASTRKWDLRGQVPVGSRAVTRFTSESGEPLSEQPVDKWGKFVFSDLVLAAGTYFLEIRGEQGGNIRAIHIDEAGTKIAGAEAEPNDAWSQANRVDFKQPVTGRMGTSGESDYFRFSIDESTAEQVLVLRLEAGMEQQFQFCLLNEAGANVQCRTAKGMIELPDLVLQPGEWGFLVKRGLESAEYSVNLAPDGPIQAGYEAEPNDSLEYASAVPSDHLIEGRFSGQDDDYYRFIIADTAQLWRFQAIGEGIEELAYLDGAGIQNQEYRVPHDQRRVRLDNVFLLPGIHHVRIGGRDGGSYTLIARAIGPPDPDGEFEPNDDTSRMQPLRFGQTRTGLLADKADRDNYRFYLANWDRIQLRIVPPPEAEILAKLYWDSVVFKQFNQPRAGQPIMLEGLFPPGDYRLELYAKSTSEAGYDLSLERLERFGCPTDCEPNDNADFANPFPPDGILEGRVNEWRDSDWYRLPTFDQSTEITVLSETHRNIEVVDRTYGAQSILTWDGEISTWTGVIPAGVQTYFHIAAWGDPAYRFQVHFSDPDTLAAQPEDSWLQLSMQLETTEVAAYRRYGQRISGQLTLQNNDETPVHVSLEVATSDYRWLAGLDESQIVIPAVGEYTANLTVEVPADAWADWPVRVSARAVQKSGAQVETFTEVTAGKDTPPINARYDRLLPDALRGGFNVAWDALGARWVGEEDTAIGSGFPMLFDGLAVEREGLQLRGTTESRAIDVIVELAGGAAVEVAGFAVNLQGLSSAPQFLRNLDIALSTDGQQFIPVISDNLLPIRAEQAFGMDGPHAARFARLRLRHAFDGRPGSQISVGEFKVIAKPGTDISAGQGFNLADPALGGHVVWSNPQISGSEWDPLLLRDENEAYNVRLKPGQAQEFVIGFHQARAAQITRAEWFEPPPDSSGSRFTRVAVAASIDSPLGPWLALGEWELAPGQSMTTMDLDKPSWARYLKFSATAEDDSGVLTTPALVRIWERPTTQNYQSIVAEWGFASQAAIYEALHPLEVEQPLRPAGHDSRDRSVELQAEQPVAGQVSLGRHVHWYHLTVPADQNTLNFALGGDPTVRTVMQLENSAGEVIPVQAIPQESSPQLQKLRAVVAPGETYYVKVEEPPRNVVFLWDTSASVGAFLPVIYNSLIAYAEDVVPGRDAVNLMPFGSKLLLQDWYGEPYIIQTVLNGYPRKESSSEAEKTMHTASMALAPRAGTKAIVMVTDAATNRYPPVWEQFASVRPRIFALGVSSQGALGRYPEREQDLMQDWSRVNGGHYTHLLSEGEMEIAFDRAATMLRRPATYTLEYQSSFIEAPGPGTLTVTAGEGEIATGGAVELILDASGSMLKRLDGRRRIVIAKEVLSEAVSEHIPPGTPVALRVFGNKEPNSCRTDLEIPLGPLDPAAARSAIGAIEAMNLAKTPIADSLARVESDLGQFEGRKIVVLVTDGEETCEGDPEQVIRSLRDKGFDVALNIVGFAIDDGELESQFSTWARMGGGKFFSARDQQGLSDSLGEALQIPFSVYDQSGSLVAEGRVDGEAVELESGLYRVSIATSPVQVYERVEIPGEAEITIDLSKSGE